MSGLLLLKLVSAVVSVSLAAGLLARDHGLKANRLIAAFLFCNAFWAGCEFALYQQDEADAAASIYRLMAFGWIPLGLFCAHASVALAAMEDHPVSRLIGPCYVLNAVVVPLAATTELVIAGAEATPLGWRPIFGPGMAAAYATMALPVFGVLASWRAVMRAAEAGGRKQLARILFFGIAACLLSGSATAVLLPLLRIDAIGVTTTGITFVGVASAWTLRRYGHALIAPEAFAREILDTLEDGVILVGSDGTLRDANRAFIRMVGDPYAVLLGSDVTTWIPGMPSSEQAGDQPALLEMRAHGGLRVPIVVSPPVACHGGGRLLGWAHLVRDRREVVSLQQRLLVSARLAAVGDLAKAISQSINEPVLQAREDLEGLSIDWGTGRDVLELARLDQSCAEALEEGAELIDECIEGIERIFLVVREVSGFSNERESEPFAAHPLDRIVARACRVASAQAPEHLEIEARLDPDVIVPCHFAELERVVTNLIVNAIQAVEPDRDRPGHIAIAVAAQEGRALLHVEDDGCGIQAEVIDRIFDPFFTTKPVGKGTGLGLAISYHIVRAHGGEIRVSSLPGRGTSVAVELPRVPIQAD